jgi:hypothetical protein
MQGIALFFGLLSVVVIGGLTIWVTSKAYSKKWDRDDDK